MDSLLRPSEWVEQFIPFLKNRSEILDLACGSGRHTRLLANNGHKVTAVDVNPQSLKKLSEVPGVEIICADLEKDRWPFASSRKFDGVVVTNYLHRPIMANILKSLNNRGILIYETFMVGNERYGKPSNPEFLLKPNELIEYFGRDLKVIKYEAGVISRQREAVIQRICAVR